MQTSAPTMNTTQRELITQRWGVVQRELTPELSGQIGPLIPRLEKVIHTLEWGRIEEFVESSWCVGVRRPLHDRGALASAFVAKAVLGLTTTTALIERLKVDRALRRICGFSMWKRLADPSTFSRAFDEFAEAKLAERVNAALMQQHFGQSLIGHINRDSTAIGAREKPANKAKVDPTTAATATAKPKRGRSCKGEVRAPKMNVITRQLGSEPDREIGITANRM